MPELCTEINALPQCPELACLREGFPEHAHLRRLLAVGGHWLRAGADCPVLLMDNGGTLLLQARSGIMVEFIHTGRHPINLTEASIERVARALNVIGARGSVLTDACACAISLSASEREVPIEIKIAIDHPCIALNSTDGAIRQLHGRMLNQRAVANAEGREWAHVRQELESFCNGLDQESVKLCRKVGTLSTSLYSYLQECGSARTRRFRHNAVAKFPILAPYIAASDESEAARLRMAIDLGESPAAALGAAFGVNQGVVRSIAGRNAFELGTEYDDNERLSRGKERPWVRAFSNAFEISRMLQCLASVPARQRPTKRAQWQVFQEAASRTAEFWPALGDSVLLMLARMAWPATLSVGKEAVHVDSALCELNHFLNAAHDALHSAMNITVIAEPLSFDYCYQELAKFTSRRGLCNLIGMNRRWHDLYCSAIEAANQAQEGDGGGRVATILLPKPVQIGTLRIAQLLTQADFIRESLESGRSIATQFGYALAGNAATFSVRNSSGQRLSAFDLRISRSKGALRVVLADHCGPRNCRPGADAMLVVEKFRQRLRE